MANDCLVTKFKKSTGNSNLPMYGMACITVVPEENPTSTNRGFMVAFTEPTTLKIEGEGYFTDENLTQNLGKTAEYTSVVGIGQTFYLSNNATCKLYLDKYKITQINTRQASHSKIANFNDFDYADSALFDLEIPGNINSIGDGNVILKKFKNTIKFFNCAETKVNLNLSSASECIVLELLRCSYDFNRLGERGKNITGDIASLAGCVKLTTLDIGSQLNVYGTLESLLAGMCTAGRTNGTLVYSGFKTQCTFHDTLDLFNLYCTFSNDGVVVTQGSGGTQIGSYAKSTGTWTYPE